MSTSSQNPSSPPSPSSSSAGEAREPAASSAEGKGAPRCLFDHIGLKVRDYQASVRFYSAALQPLGFSLQYEDAASSTAGFGPQGQPQLWLGAGEPGTGIHLAFTAADHAAVGAFHRAALAAGGKDNGAPGLRPEYHPHYYGAFVLDPDGNNVEAVCHKPQHAG
jgi:catechol 2,3-dioxygenase-like lactoylglutathione lyase family enzyme